MKKEKATIHDISKSLGIDSSTVSRALNDSPRVSKTTKDAVIQKAKELGYQKNSLASNLRTNKTHTIAVVLPRISRHFFSTVIAGIEETAYEAGYNVIICQTLDILDREKKIMSTLISNRVDGVIISISMETTNYEHLEAYRNLNNPIIFFDRPCDLENCTNINIDNFHASFMTTEHLIFEGCKHIAHFSGSQNIELYRQRKNGYLAALKKHNIKVNDHYIFESNLSEEDGINSAKKLLKLGTVDGLISANDTAAIAAMQYFKSQGIKVPEDISVAGFNNDPISAVIDPSLTTINQPAFDIGKRASSLLLELIESKSTNTDTPSTVLNSELIIRNSSKKS
ncbi:LacI family transcriptional regulator [Pseudalgibacter alginicilyticus]|uniref:LacI family transcriptional regulator n=1 Tax=Pseudalgibacter alginicilyticus TaxID=1736674 RepID=A0A0P0D1V4_9FLAO|nr:LacI family DNA-binding transcriptional regulator [Pseudalgibacter alginicilyticus]ALJ03728.1 LacI family transcriptional regulator [Pseudalgibacter alginicilyticus]